MRINDQIPSLFNQYNYKDNKIILSIGFLIGLATTHLKRKDEELLINPATQLFLLDAKKDHLLLDHSIDVKVKVGINDSHCTVQTTTAEFNQLLAKLTDEFMNYLPSKEVFEEKKQLLLKRYKKKYQDKEYRYWLRLNNFAHYQKRFNDQKFHQSLECLTYEEVSTVQENVFNVSNIYLFVNGNIKDIEDASTFKRIAEKYSRDDFWTSLTNIRKNEDPIPKKEEVPDQFDESYFIKHIDLIDSPLTQIEIFTLLQVMAQCYEKRPVSLQLDGVEASLMWKTEKEELEIKPIEAKDLEKIKEKLTYDFIQKLHRMPLSFNSWVIEHFIHGISLMDYIQLIDQVSMNSLDEFMGWEEDYSLTYSCVFKKRDQVTFI